MVGPVFGKSREKNGPKLKRLDGIKANDAVLSNPRATVPIMDDDGFVLWESHAIMEYLCVKHGWEDLLPTELHARAKVSQYLHFHHRNVREATRLWSKTIWKNVYDRKNPTEAWMARNTFPALTNNDQAVKHAVEIVEGMLEETGAFLTGPNLTIADISCYEELGQNQPKFANVQSFSEFPSICRWLLAMEKLPAFQQAHAILSMIGDVNTVTARRESVPGVPFNKANGEATRIIEECIAGFSSKL